MARPGRFVLILCFCLFGATPARRRRRSPARRPRRRAAGETDAASKTETLSKYRLSTGDVISITVYGEDDLKRDKVRLTDAGTISYPVLGEIQVRGKTVGELEKIITDGLRGTLSGQPARGGDHRRVPAVLSSTARSPTTAAFPTSRD